MKNTLGDLSIHLFAELERLSDEDLKGEELKEEINRSYAIGKIATKVIDNANLVLQAAKFKDSKLTDEDMPRLLGGK